MLVRMIFCFRVLVGIFLLFGSCACAGGGDIEGRVVRIADGDTVTVLQENSQYKIRLYGIDTPERKQAFGRAAREELKAMLSTRVVVEKKAEDRYGRTVGIVYSGGLNINRELVKNGYAWVYRKYCKESFCNDWLAMEKAARDQKKGLWKERAIPPWEFRKR